MRLQVRCENSCGFYGELCCESHEICSTSDDERAVCIADGPSATNTHSSPETSIPTTSTSTATTSTDEAQPNTTTRLQSSSAAGPYATDSSQTPRETASRTGLSSDAKIGIGVCVALVAILIIAAVLWFRSRQKRSAQLADQPTGPIPAELFTIKPELEGSRVMPRYAEKPELDGHAVLKAETAYIQPAFAELADSPLSEAATSEVPGDSGTRRVNERTSQENASEQHNSLKGKTTFLADPWRWSQPLSTLGKHTAPE